jgi:hypothetical protein
MEVLTPIEQYTLCCFSLLVTFQIVYSNLLQNLQDHCAAAGIEIMSPYYAALSDGHQKTIPAKYLPKEHTHPGSQIDLPE